MEVVWAPWRMEFILGAKAMNCFVCEALKTGVSVETLVLHVTSHSVVMLNRYPYISGHLMVIPHRHVASLSDLKKEEMEDLNETLRRTTEVVNRVLSPDGVNLGMNLGKAAGAGLEDHIHWHIVPRFMGDSNAFTVLADARVIPEALVETYERYAPAFQQLMQDQS
jgi:ATP adenylyltransferase